MKELVQNSKEWQEWRHKGIGASDANIIMGVSRFKTPAQLLAEKQGEVVLDSEQTFITQKGHKLEDIARKKLELETFLDWEPKLMEHKDEPRFRCSLDGYNESMNAIWECKYMGLEKYTTLKNSSLKPIERIPSEYWPQLMHQVMVSDAAEVRFTGIVDHRVDKTLEKGKTDQYTLVFGIGDEHYKYITDELLPKLTAFLHKMETKGEIELGEDDTMQVKDSSLSKKLTAYKNTKKKLDEWAAKEKDLKKEIFDMAGKIHNRVECNGHKVTVTMSENKTVPDVDKYLKENKIDLIQLGYTKIQKGKQTKKITLKKETKK